MIAKRYGLKPSDIKDDSLEDYQFNMLVVSVALDEETKQAKKAAQKRRG